MKPREDPDIPSKQAAEKLQTMENIAHQSGLCLSVDITVNEGKEKNWKSGNV